MRKPAKQAPAGGKPRRGRPQFLRAPRTISIRIEAADVARLDGYARRLELSRSQAVARLVRGL